MRKIPYLFFSFQRIRRVATLTLLGGTLVLPGLSRAQTVAPGVTQAPIPHTYELSLITPLGIGGLSGGATGPQLSLRTCPATGSTLKPAEGIAPLSPCTVKTLTVEQTDQIFANIELLLSVNGDVSKVGAPELPLSPVPEPQTRE